MTGIATGMTSRVGNAWRHYVGDGIEPADPTPSTVVHDEPHAVLRRYTPHDLDGDPVLLVPPLAVHASCFDLRPGQSLVAHLADGAAGDRPVYLVDFGEVGFADRHLGFEDWIDRILPETIDRVSDRHGRRPVDVVTWSLGGTVTLLTAAANPDLPLRSIAAVGTPIDYAAVPYLAPLRAVGTLTGGRVLDATFRAAGGLPSWAVRGSFRFTALRREITKPWFVLRHLHDAETMGRLEAVDRFIGQMPGYPGRFYAQLYRNAVQANQLHDGYLQLSAERRVELADVTQDVLIVAGRTDVIGPPASVRRACDVLTGARSVRYALEPGSHLGVLTGPEATTTTWPAVTGFLRDVQRMAAAG
ncbi:alpha/beta fold hydrolase [Jatrophihabitans fulvus]